MRRRRVPHPLAVALSLACTLGAPFLAGYAITRPSDRKETPMMLPHVTSSAGGKVNYSTVQDSTVCTCGTPWFGIYPRLCPVHTHAGDPPPMVPHWWMPQTYTSTSVGLHPTDPPPWSPTTRLARVLYWLARKADR